MTIQTGEIEDERKKKEIISWRNSEGGPSCGRKTRERVLTWINGWTNSQRGNPDEEAGAADSRRESSSLSFSFPSAAFLNTYHFPSGPGDGDGEAKERRLKRSWPIPHPPPPPSSPLQLSPLISLDSLSIVSPNKPVVSLTSPDKHPQFWLIYSPKLVILLSLLFFSCWHERGVR